jgi:hypothetical protein
VVGSELLFFADADYASVGATYTSSSSPSVQPKIGSPV